MASNRPTVLEPDLAEQTRHAPLYRVLIHNDSKTPMDFVCGVLKYVFNKTFRESVQIMLEAHNRDVALVVMEAREQAEFHVERAHSLSRPDYPLTFTYEPES